MVLMQHTLNYGWHETKKKKVAHIAYKLTHFMLTDLAGGYRDVLQLIRVR